MIDLAGKNDVQVYPLSEAAVTIEFGTAIDEAIIKHVHAFDRLLNQKRLPGMYQTVPAYASLTIFFDPLMLIRSPLPGKTCFDKARGYLMALDAEQAPLLEAEPPPVITIPVCYGGRLGPDLEYTAAHCQISAAEVIQLHSAVTYEVCMIGFIPGFAYLGGLNPLLQIPRKPTPLKVSPGAVGIGGSQTGIYPLETPGGWQIIGRTPFCLFDAKRPQPALLRAGGRVKFEPISFSDFEKYRGK